MFKKGQLITGTANRYGVTNEKSLCIINRVLDNGYINVDVVAHQEASWRDCKCNDDVESSYFTLCTYAEFMEKYPDAKLVLKDTYPTEILAKITNNETETEIKEEKIMELRMNKETYGAYELTSEEKETLRKEIINLLYEYHYNPHTHAVNKILDEWVKNKGWMINLFKKHPNYNGKFQIAFDADFNRVCDANAIKHFVEYAIATANATLLQEVKIGCFTYSEVHTIYNRLKSVHKYMENIILAYPYGCTPQVLVNGKTYREIHNEMAKFQQKISEYQSNENIYIPPYSSMAYDRAKYNLYNNVKKVFDKLYYYRDQNADEELVEFINTNLPSIKAVVGQKTSRIVNKICKLIGIDKDANYNREFAKFADAINPLLIKRHTILSIHPVDYFTMSFGNSWASCHTIDKDNDRGMPDSYEGCYSSGTLSYMLDSSSFVFYTVDKDYNGNAYELQDKINRNMFHMGEDKLIQARVYPQDNDGENGIYKQIREIAQKVMADCLEVPNMWKNVKGTSECSAMINSYGTHYRDYTSYSNCNVSYLKGDTDAVNETKIVVGHTPICPNCGDEHHNAECIECEACYDGERECYECGCYYDADDMYEIDGRYYCSECTFYCDYHDRREVGSGTYVEGYGDVCDDAIDEGFYSCEQCGSLYHNEDGIETEDGSHFCCEYCAERAGYIELSNGEWHLKEDTYYCEHCDEYVLEGDWNEELQCCVNCEEVVAEENEDEDEDE